MAESVIERAAIACFIWAAALVLCNPFLEGPKRKIAAIIFAAIGTILAVLAP